MREKAIEAIHALFGLQDPVAQEVLATQGYPLDVELEQIDDTTLETIAIRCRDAHLSTLQLLEDPSD